MKDININISEAERALTEKPLLATSVERVLILHELRSFGKELPQPLRCAALLRELLSRVSLPLEPYDLIAGRCVDRLLDEREEQIFRELSSPGKNPARTALFGGGHCVFEWELLVKEGLVGLRRRAEEGLSAQRDGERRIFLEGMIGIYDAVIAYLLRYAAAAEEKGMHAVARNLTECATAAPTTFAAALQLLFTVTLIDCAYLTPNPTLTVGRLDQILYPFYQRDLAAGILTREEAGDYITDYYCKHNLIMGRGEHQVGDATNSTTFDRIYCFDAPQYLLLAGTDARGESAVNDLTLLFAECIRPSFKNPVIVVRYFKGMNEKHPALWQVLMEKALQSASMMFYHDGNMLATWERLGIPKEECRNYAHFGCNWPTIGVHGAWTKGTQKSPIYRAYASPEEAEIKGSHLFEPTVVKNWPETFVRIMEELAAREGGEPLSIEDFYTAFFAEMGELIDRKLQISAKEVEIRQRRPAAVLTFADCFFADAIEAAGGHGAVARYHFDLQTFSMFGTVADCFITVDELVFQKKRVTLGQLFEAVKADFKGYEGVLALCRSVEKYGSDTPFSNAHATRLSHTFAALVADRSRPYVERCGVLLTPCMQSDTWHLKMGEQSGATPDGRRAGMLFSQNTRPAGGACKNGLTAMLASMLCLPQDGLLSGALNLDIDPADFKGKEGERLLGALLATYFNRGGLHAQISAAGKEELVDAQIHPELHRDLRVRVTGYSGVFVDITKRLQDDIIKRFE